MHFLLNGAIDVAVIMVDVSNVKEKNGREMDKQLVFSSSKIKVWFPGERQWLVNGAAVN